MFPFRSLVLAGALLAAGSSYAEKPGAAGIEEPDKESVEQKLELFDNNKGETVCKVKGKVCFKASTNTEGEGTEASPFKRRTGKGDWVIDVFGNFKKPSLAGATQFIFSDTVESKAIKKRDLTAQHQVTLKVGNGVSARVRLSGDDGFRVGRTYKVYVVQILAGKEFILAESEFKLQ